MNESYTMNATDEYGDSSVAKYSGHSFLRQHFRGSVCYQSDIQSHPHLHPHSAVKEKCLHPSTN